MDDTGLSSTCRPSDFNGAVQQGVETIYKSGFCRQTRDRFDAERVLECLSRLPSKVGWRPAESCSSF